MCGAGKSTTTRELSLQFEYLSLPHRWVHEEISNHPIRSGEFEAGDITSAEGMDVNVKDMIGKWQRLIRAVDTFAGTYIMEGCFIHAIDRHFAYSAYGVEQTLDYFDSVSKMLAEAGMLYVYLRSPDIRATLENAFVSRGQWWKELILAPEDRFFHITEYKGDETAYEYWHVFQDISDKVFERYTGDKLLLNVPNGTQGALTRKVMNHMNIPFIDVPPVEISLPDKYCGTYSAVINGMEHGITINYDSVNKSLYADERFYEDKKGYWPYVRLVPISNNCFKTESFPITLTFSEINNKHTVYVSGECGSSFLGRTLSRS